MSVDTMMNEIIQQNEKILAQIEELKEEKESLNSQISELKSQSELIDAEILDKEELLKVSAQKIAIYTAMKEEQKLNFLRQQAAFNTLYAKSEAGSITSSDLEEFRATAGYEIPIAETDEGDESEAEELAATGT